MTKTLSGVTLTSPSGAVNGNAGDTFAFTATPSLSGSGGVNRYDLKFEVNPGSGFVAMSASTGLSTSGANPASNLNTASATSITVTCSVPGSYTIRVSGAPTTGGSFTLSSSTQTVNVAAASHAASGALAGAGSSVAGTASRTRLHASSGALACAGSLAGSASRTRVHAVSGALPGVSSDIAGTAAHGSAAVNHDASGTLAETAVLDGAARRFREIAASGSLFGGIGSTVGVASRSRQANTHDALAVLTGSGGAFGVARRMDALAAGLARLDAQKSSWGKPGRDGMFRGR